MKNAALTLKYLILVNIHFERNYKKQDGGNFEKKKKESEMQRM